MGFYERIDTRGAWETGRPVSFIPKGALTHHPEGAVVLPAATVRSARRMRLLRKPYVQCHSSADLLSLATQSANCFGSSSKQLFPFWKQLAACPHKPATGSFICGYDPNLKLGSFSLWKEKQKLYERFGTNKWRSIIWKQRL